VNLGLPSEPIVFAPVYKDKIWGGRNLLTILNKDLPPDQQIGESWELSDTGPDQTFALSGPFAGKSLGEIYSKHKEELVGPSGSRFDTFPLLFKFIDAQQKLSVQVHPNDIQARENGWGNQGKTECWYIIDAKPGAQLIIGFKRDVTKDEIRNAVESNSLESILNYIDVKPGDVVYLPAGTVHALLGDIVLYEVQQTSDTTFRLYDWGRTDDSGKKRPLHIEQAIDVVNTNKYRSLKINPVVIDYNTYIHSYAIACEYFSIEKIFFSKPNSIVLPPKKSFRMLSVTGEPIELLYGQKTLTISKGCSVLIPSVLKDIKVNGSERAEFLMSTVPDIKNEIIRPLFNSGIDIPSIKGLGANDIDRFF
jgi:mannose-6-phosphate isomerase